MRTEQQTTEVDVSSARYMAIWEAYTQGEELRVSAKPETHRTLQGRLERGYVVNGRNRGGDRVWIMFPTREEADAYMRYVPDHLPLRVY